MNINITMTAREALKRYFGYDEFRSGQEALIDAIMAGRDVLGIMPTGAGKSVCFQIPALMADGVTLVVSPLISLMKDQVNALTQSGVPAAFINSSLTQRQIDRALQNAREGAYKLIYVAPERLPTPDFLSFVKSVRVSMLTVDEAHCISQWGQDFRPSYAQIPEFITELPARPVVSAFTATATPRVRSDIVNLLELRDPRVLITGFDRQNLSFDVERPTRKYPALTAFLKDKKESSGIVYCSTRKLVEEVCERLRHDGYNASRYHAGLSDGERRGNQDDFLYDRAQIMVATNAFGMGIDKSNVSFVVHYNMPKDIESYYQEAGRSGRDGSPANCLLLYNYQDVRMSEWMIENDKDVEYPDPETERMLKARAKGRLRQMTNYCATTGCLRGYILKYFGESPPARCGNCGNCNTDFETADITVDAQKILSCVARMNERFGAHMVMDVLRGTLNEKVTGNKFDKLSTFGILDKPVGELRQMIDVLMQGGYLMRTDDDYPVIKLGELADGVLRRGVKVEMKLAKERTRESLKESRRYGDKYGKYLSTDKPVRPVDKKLFEVLRKLRSDISKEQGVPAFVVFADSTLIDMCIKIPRSQDEMYDVSGVGSVKFERYGERFLGAINEYVSTYGITEPAADAQNTAPQKYDAANVEISEEPVTASMIADRINCILIEIGRPKIYAAKINEWLISEGYMETVVINDSNRRVPTAKGAAIGITMEDREIRGENIPLCSYGKPAQELIAQNALKIETSKRAR